jgi:hypothetical protein
MGATSDPVIDRPAGDAATALPEPVASFVVEVRTREHARSGNATKMLTEKLTAAFEDSEFDITIIPTDTPATSPQQRAEMRGEARLVGWTQDGTLVDGGKIEQAWGVRRQTVDAARERGEIFSIWVKNKHWYPGEALHFERSDLAAINQALGDIDPSSKLLFLLRQHGGLGGRTPAEAVESNRFEDVIRLAAEWGRT